MLIASHDNLSLNTFEFEESKSLDSAISFEEILLLVQSPNRPGQGQSILQRRDCNMRRSLMNTGFVNFWPETFSLQDKKQICNRTFIFLWN